MEGDNVSLNSMESEAKPIRKKREKHPAAFTLLEEPKKIRRKKRVKTDPDERPDVFFHLTDGKLQAVKINWGMLKPIATKDLPDGEKTVLAMWNRNKDLFK